jgi:hypothetical protein
LRVGVIDAVLHDLAQPFGVAQVEHPHAAPRHLVLVARADPASRGAYRLARRALGVHQLVIGEHEMRAVADVEAPLDVHAVAHQTIHLGEESVGVEHDAVADGAAHARVQDPARDLVEHELSLLEHHRVPGVRAPLVAHHPVGALREHVDQLTLPLVSPLRADDDDGALLGTEHWPPDKKTRPAHHHGALF